MYWYIFWLHNSRLELVQGPFTEATAYKKAAEGEHGYPLIRESYSDDKGVAIDEFVDEIQR